MIVARLPRLALGLALSLPSLAVLLAPRDACASGFLADGFGADHGHPALGNAYSVFFNPAAMGGATGTVITLDGFFAARSESFNRNASSLTPADKSTLTDPTYLTANTGQATLFNVLATPFLGFMTDFGGSKFRLGLASYIPFGGQVSWQKLDSFQGYPGAPGAYDGPQRWASISTQFSSLYETAALAYRVEPMNLSIGANVSVIRTGVQDTRARTASGTDDLFQLGKIHEGRSYLDVSGIEFGAGLGVYWEPSRNVHVGASYTSQPNFGTMRLSGTYKLYTPDNALISSNVDFLEAYPDVIRAGVAWRVAPDAELRLDGSYQRWSALTNQCVVNTGGACNVNANGSTVVGDKASQGIQANVPRNFQDAYHVRLGASYWVEPQTEVFASTGLDTSAVKSAYQDPLVFDSTRVAGTLGVSHGFSDHVYAQAAYTYLYYVPVTVTDSAYGGYQQPSRSPSENGSYDQSLYIVDVAVSYRF